MIGLAYDAYCQGRRALPLEEIRCKNRVDVEALAFLVRAAQQHTLATVQLGGRADWQARLRPLLARLPRSSAWRHLCDLPWR